MGVCACHEQYAPCAPVTCFLRVSPYILIQTKAQLLVKS